ncbi:MAG: GNAT family N-acetyltransferase [Deltaproteobacteria bacterium]|nr:GNAT family N-acetyltransferase [Deltaproteobacteria bacterium]
MSTLIVRRATPSADLSALLELERRIYRGDPVHVPKIELLERRRLAPSNPFFQTAELVLFLAERDGAPVGSISVLRDLGDLAREPGVVFFGFFEVIEDEEVARALVEAAEAQAIAWGATELQGPRDLTRVEYIGLSVDGFDRRPPMLQGTHRPYYQAFLERAGFKRHHDHYAYESSLVGPDGPAPPPRHLKELAEACDVPGVTVRRARWTSIDQDIRGAHEVLNDAFQTVPDVSPMPLATWRTLGYTFLPIMSTELLQIAHVGAEPVAFAMCIPEINGAQAALRGRFLPFGWARALAAMRAERTAGFKFIGVKQAWRGRGLHAKMVLAIVEGMQRAGYERVDASIVDERNAPMRAVAERAGMRVWRTYRVYRKHLG